MGDTETFFFQMVLVFSIWTQIVELNDEILLQMHNY